MPSFSTIITGYILALAISDTVAMPTESAVPGLQDLVPRDGTLMKRYKQIGNTEFTQCLQSKEPGWPQKQATRQQSEECRQATQHHSKRAFPSSPLGIEGWVFTEACNMGKRVDHYLRNDDVAKNVKHNEIKDDTPSKLVSETICPPVVDFAMGVALKQPDLIGEALVSVEGVNTAHDRQGPKLGGIVKDHQSLDVLTTLSLFIDPKKPTGLLKGLATDQIRKRLIDACGYAYVRAGKSCVDDVKYGFINSATQKALNPYTGYLFDGMDLIAQFDLGSAMDE